jgi:hypothetical protein
MNGLLELNQQSVIIMKELFNHSRMSVSRMFGIISGLLSLILMILVSVPAMGQLAPDKSKMMDR